MMTAAMRYFTAFAAALLFAACRGGGSDVGDFCEEVYTPRYAGGFVILGAGGRQSTILRTRNPWQGAEGVDTELFIARNGEKAPDGFTGQVLTGEASRVVCMSSGHIAMMDAIGAVDRIVGVSGIDYVTNGYIAANRPPAGGIGDVGYDGNIDYERLASLRPDLVMLYGLNGISGMEHKLRELGIPFVYVGDYLEESPLGKAEWMVAAGEIAGRRAEAQAVYDSIPVRYNALKQRVAAETAAKPSVMVNIPYGDSWFMTPTASYAAQLIADAGGDYIYKRNTSNRSLPVDIEEAALLTARADVWINVGSLTTLDELRRTLPRFADARCVREGRVWNCNRRTNPSGGNDYWESGIVHPDIILCDLVMIFHPGLLPDTLPCYYRRLE